MQTALAYPRPRAALSLWAVADRAAPPSERVVAAVQIFGDVEDAREDGTILRRFSTERLEQEDMRLLLGEECDRAAQVSIVWDEQEEQLVSVLDAAPLTPRARLIVSQGGRTGNRYADARMRGAVRAPAADQAVAA